MENSVGVFLQQWRKKRRYSQLQLSLELGVSSKHISFIETGRSVPSKEMLLKITEFLLLNKSEINRGFHLAGYAAVYSDLPVDHEELKPVIYAIDQMLENHMPYPALVLDKNWNVVNANESAKKLLFELGYSGHNNLIEALILDDPKISKISNWYEAISIVLTRLRAEISVHGCTARLIELEQRLSSCIPQNVDFLTLGAKNTVPSVRFKIGDEEHAFFSIIAQLTTIQDITLNEFKVELMFPTDEKTKVFFEGGG